jgi:hypothetical protein
MTLPDRTRFESAYAGLAPWDIGRPQKALVDMAGRITGSLLDSGCGIAEQGKSWGSFLSVSICGDSFWHAVLSACSASLR